MQNSKMAKILDFFEPNPDSFNYRSVEANSIIEFQESNMS